MSREKLIYKEKYKKNFGIIGEDSLPILKHTPSGFIVRSAQVKEAGIVERDNERLEYQDIRVYLKKGVIS